ncbi:hypothetical protein F3Y22_tig00110647pilonHSYRG00098 [Hibiscus syriacus]|uniref:Stigma-specific STIG1-like protein 1 n=1 Tax=Hibiscus syriacus TaxID=106335 RepID=A0A6A3A0N3_HIBSY|nr:hypothetical protein F3Y22_tig00110647pilonHSYRG00098 [Hibiscus syriacus]
MKALNIFMVIVLFMALAITNLSATQSQDEEDRSQVEPPSVGVTNRFRAQKPKKRCVNVTTDRLNCGKCGRMCEYSEICCKGNCVNPMSNKWHCSVCNNGCDKGSKCLYGMCSYA